MERYLGTSGSSYDYRAAWEHCRLLAGHTRRSVKPRPVPPEKALGPVALADEEGLWRNFLACAATVLSVSHRGLTLIAQ